jgi:outer membrane protein assembly factor BamB
MTTHVTPSTARNPLRLWPGVVLAAVLVLARYVLPVVAGDAAIFSVPLAMLGVLGGVAVAAAIAVWWLFFSRAPWLERVGVLALMVAAFFATRFIADLSISRGMMGMMPVIYGVPLLALALVSWAATTQHVAAGARGVALVAAIGLACLPLTLLRSAGIRGAGAELHLRWTPTPEERMLAQQKDEPAPQPARPAENVTASSGVPGSVAPAPNAPEKPAPSTAAAPAGTASAPEPARAASYTVPAEWPGFRGPLRDGVVHGVRINTDWSSSPPREIWRRAIGPGWSSFAVRGDFIYTQEQRGDDEVVSCYRLSTGEPVWRHRDPIRFWESEGGAGPRATPTVHDGRVFAMGATGIVNALDADTGALIWSRNAPTDTEKTVPDWGVASSPVVFNGLVIVGVAGRLAAYDAATGATRWLGPTGGGGYSSPHLTTLHGVPQIVMLRGARTVSVSPDDGALLWEFSTGVASVSIVQPAFTADGDVLISDSDTMIGNGVRRVAISRTAQGWTAQERWNSRGLKPAFNDYVVHKGHAYGFDPTILSAIDLSDGARKWKGGRYGNGQLVLLADQDLLLVVSEEGELALVSATPDEYRELARIPVLNGKTWNHPVVVKDILLMRNGEEMVAFRLPRSNEAPPVRDSAIRPVPGEPPAAAGR